MGHDGVWGVRAGPRREGRELLQRGLCLGSLPLGLASQAGNSEAWEKGEAEGGGWVLPGGSGWGRMGAPPLGGPQLWPLLLCVSGS